MPCFNHYALLRLVAGFAFLSVNFRGSSTFGRAFERKVWSDLGHWELEDVVAARTFLIEQVCAPVLILSGRNDDRSPAGPIELYERKLKEAGKAIEVVWFDAGHIGAALQTELGIAYQEHMLRFAVRVLGQPSMDRPELDDLDT